MSCTSRAVARRRIKARGPTTRASRHPQRAVRGAARSARPFEQSHRFRSSLEGVLGRGRRLRGRREGSDPAPDSSAAFLSRRGAETPNAVTCVGSRPACSSPGSMSQTRKCHLLQPGTVQIERRSFFGPEVHTASSATGWVHLEDPSALPRRFHSSAVVSTSHPCDCLKAWDARQHRDRRQRRPGPADAATACELDALRSGASVGLCERGDRVVRRCRCAEVAPPHPSVVPFEGTGIARQEVDAEFGLEAVGQRVSQSTTADSAATGELHDVRTIRPRDHDGIVKGRCSTTADIPKGECAQGWTHRLDRKTLGRCARVEPATLTLASCPSSSARSAHPNFRG